MIWSLIHLICTQEIRSHALSSRQLTKRNIKDERWLMISDQDAFTHYFNFAMLYCFWFPVSFDHDDGVLDFKVVFNCQTISTLSKTFFDGKIILNFGEISNKWRVHVLIFTLKQQFMDNCNLRINGLWFCFSSDVNSHQHQTICMLFI